MSLTTRKSGQALRFGTIGIRGYGGAVYSRLAEQHIKEVDGIQFVAACDPSPQECSTLINKYREVDIKIVRSADELFAMDLDAVWLPLPIHLHREYTIAALERGIAVICEKPAAGCVQDVDAMISVQKKTGLPVLVAFHHLFDPVILDANNTLASGRLGKIKRAVVYGCWPRSSQYYLRNDWAGRKRIGQRIVNDSPACNAMSHYIMLALFLSGSTPGAAAEVKHVQSYLYRAANIENYDTISMRITTTSGIEVDVHLTHASRTEVTPTVRVYTERGHINVTDNRNIIIEHDGDCERIPCNNQSHYLIAPTLVGLIQGKVESYEPASLANVRQHVMACELASQNTSVIDIDSGTLTPAGDLQDNEYSVIKDIEAMIMECVHKGQLLDTL